MIDQSTYKLYPYRWVVLAVFMFVNITIQMLWITFAPITILAADYYNVSDSRIGLLSMVFMIAFIPLSIPVSWGIDTFGFKRTVGIGTVLMAVFGIMRGLVGNNYGWVLFSTIGIAIAQPFLLNAWTKVPALWFGHKERATAVGLVTLASLIGTAIGMVLTPELVKTMAIDRIQLIYGIIAAISTVLFILLAREKPATPPDRPGEDARALMLDGLKHALSIPKFWIYLFISFVGLGLFNGITTWVEPIIRLRGFSPDDAGTLGALMLGGGLVGAVIMPIFSDKQRKRQIFILLGFILAIPGLLGVTFSTTAWLLFLSAFWMGFFLVGANPVGMQYAAEITHPTPEGTSNGLIQLFGQASVVFVTVMDQLKTNEGSFTPSLMLMVGLLVLSSILILFMKDPENVPKMTLL
ncbi:MAG: MFS transporter [Anaerolineales bacterium]